jgi:hypothetical protein
MDHLTQPKDLSPAGILAYTAITTLVTNHDLQTGGCKAFYSPKEWSSRGEKYGARSELIIVYDGGELGEVCRLDGAFYNELVGSLKGYGLYVEECTGWYAAVYPC